MYFTNPWREARLARERASLAERRAAEASDRAAYLERHIQWLRDQMVDSRKSEVTTLKVIANVSSQLAYGGFVPFPEAVKIPAKKESDVRELMREMDEPDAVDAAHTDFVKREMAEFSKPRTQ